MTQTVHVTRAQKDAAQLMIELSERTGQPVSDAVRKIAGAAGPRPTAPITATATR